MRARRLGLVALVVVVFLWWGFSVKDDKENAQRDHRRASRPTCTPASCHLDAPGAGAGAALLPRAAASAGRRRSARSRTRRSSTGATPSTGSRPRRRSRRSTRLLATVPPRRRVRRHLAGLPRLPRVAGAVDEARLAEGAALDAAARSATRACSSSRTSARTRSRSSRTTSSRSRPFVYRRSRLARPSAQALGRPLMANENPADDARPRRRPGRPDRRLPARQGRPRRRRARGRGPGRRAREDRRESTAIASTSAATASSRRRSRSTTLWHEMLGDEFLRRPRMSRIYWNNRYLDYPLRGPDVIKKLGPVELARCMALVPARRRDAATRSTSSLEDWVTNRFGRRLFELFFKTLQREGLGRARRRRSAPSGRRSASRGCRSSPPRRPRSSATRATRSRA